MQAQEKTPQYVRTGNLVMDTDKCRTLPFPSINAAKRYVKLITRDLPIGSARSVPFPSKMARQKALWEMHTAQRNLRTSRG